MICMFVCVLVCGFIPGILSQAPDYETTPEPVRPSSFTCQGRAPGYYADLDTGCKSYHVCDGSNHFTYVCPKRTLFQQRSRICDHEYLVQCEDSVHYYEGEDVYQDLDEEDLGEEEEEQEGEEEVGDERGGDYDYILNKEKLENFEEETEEPTPSVETTTREVVQTATETIPIEVNSSATNLTRVQSPREIRNSSGNGFLKFSLKDSRWLFYIPEVGNNSIGAGRTVREFVLPLDTTEDRMRFKMDPPVGSNGSHSLCPKVCNPRFLLPGTCHPCIMIK